MKIKFLLWDDMDQDWYEGTYTDLMVRIVVDVLWYGLILLFAYLVLLKSAPIITEYTRNEICTMEIMK